MFSAVQNIISNSVRMHHLDSLLLKVSLQVKLLYQITSESNI